MKKFLFILLLLISIISFSESILKPEIIYNSEVIKKIIPINNKECLLVTVNGLKIFNLKTRKISNDLKNQYFNTNTAFNYLSNIAFDGEYYYIKSYFRKNNSIKIYMYSKYNKLLNTFEYENIDYLIMSETGKFLLKKEKNNYSIIDTVTQKEVQKFKNLSIVPGFIVSPDKKFVIFSDYSLKTKNTFLYLYNFENGEFIKKIIINNYAYSINIFPYIRFYKDEFYILNSDNLYVFDSKTYQLKTKLLSSNNNFCVSYFINKDKIYIQNNCEFLIFNRDNKKLIRKIKIDNYESLFNQIVVSEDETYLIGIKSQESRIRLYKIN